MLKTLGGDGDEGLLARGEDLVGERGVGRVAVAETAEGFGEDVSLEEEVAGVDVGSGDGVGINAVKR